MVAAVNLERAAQGVAACYSCASACDSCAVACLHEEDHLGALTRCIALDLDCAEVCRAMAALLARDSELFPTLAEACASACDVCANECEQHDMEHCRKCAAACRRCADACRALVQDAHAGDASS